MKKFEKQWKKLPFKASIGYLIGMFVFGVGVGFLSTSYYQFDAIAWGWIFFIGTFIGLGILDFMFFLRKK